MASAENALYTALLPSQFQDSTDVTATTRPEITSDGTSLWNAECVKNLGGGIPVGMSKS